MLGSDYAFVIYNPAAGAAVANAIVGYAAAGVPDKGPGVTQADAVQLVSHMAVVRNAITYGYRGPAAKYNVATKAFEGVEFMAKRGRELEAIGEHVFAKQQVIPILGAEKLRDAWPGSGPSQHKNNWGPTLALALDGAMRKVATAERADQPPPGYGAIQVALPLLAIGIIVGGVAVTVVGVVAAWRYLDPDARRDIAIAEAASNAYASRLAAAQQTGIMPPASPVEEQAVGGIVKIAKAETQRDWMIGAAIVGGIAVTAIGGAAVSRLVA